MMDKCDCYYECIKAEPRYSQYTGEYVNSVDVKCGVCYGTKERDECSCGGDRTKCDFYPDIREKAMREEKFINIGAWNNGGVKAYIDDDGAILIKAVDGTIIKMTNKDLYFIDKYGNEMSINELNSHFKSNSPSYEELYNYWMNTKQND